MTGMEHAIEQVAKRLHSSYCECEGWYAECQGPQVGDRRVARRLAAEGLIAPAPLREEWSARYVNGGGSICRTRNEAEAALDRMTRDSHRFRLDEPPAPEIAGIYARYVSDWEPVDRAEGESWYDAEPDAMPDAGWEPIEPVDRVEGDGSAET